MDTISKLKFPKGLNSVKSACRVMVLDLCTSSDNALYLYNDLLKHLEIFQSY